MSRSGEGIFEKTGKTIIYWTENRKEKGKEDWAETLYLVGGPSKGRSSPPSRGRGSGRLFRPQLTKDDSSELFP